MMLLSCLLFCFVHPSFSRRLNFAARTISRNGVPADTGAHSKVEGRILLNRHEVQERDIDGKQQPLPHHLAKQAEVTPEKHGRLLATVHVPQQIPELGQHEQQQPQHPEEKQQQSQEQRPLLQQQNQSAQQQPPPQEQDQLQQKPSLELAPQPEAPPLHLHHRLRAALRRHWPWYHDLLQELAADREVIRWLGLGAGTFLVWALLLALASRCFYCREQLVPEHPWGESPGAQAAAWPLRTPWSLQVWRYPLYDCWGDPEVCAWSWLCPLIQWADSLSKAGVAPFRATMALYILGHGLGILLAGHIAAALIVGRLRCPPWLTRPLLLWAFACLAFRWAACTMLAVYGRRRLKATYRIDGEDKGFFGNLRRDLTIHCCCMCCAVEQEARHVHAAWRLAQGPEALAPSGYSGQ